MHTHFLGLRLSHWLNIGRVMERHGVRTPEALDAALALNARLEKRRKLAALLRPHVTSDYWARRVAGVLLENEQAVAEVLR